ncbi:hypothetical protein IL306_000901 [Fusarium sp. DS 682]|nr:hypothetical protein IL306_000901 [Fusarium sp. DS 682]
MQDQQKPFKLDISRRVTEEVKRSTGYKEVTSAWKFASDEYGKIRSLTRGDKDFETKLYQFLAHYVAPTANSDFKIFDDAKLDAWQDIDVPEAQKWLAVPGEDLSIPFRMIDLFTGNLVETKNYGPLDQYCILSHSWKGQEIDCEYFTRAKRSTYRLNSKYGDVEAVAALARDGAREPYRRLQELIKKPGKCQKHEAKTVEALLKMHFEVLAAERDCRSADKGARQGLELRTSAAWEAEHYRSYVKGLHKPRSKGDAVEAPLASLDDKIKKLEEGACSNEARMLDRQKTAYSELEKRKADTDLHINDTEIMYAIEDLLEALYYRKSARKLLGAVEQAKKTFGRPSFPPTGRRYLWLDNCCIKKSNAGELTESLARMGEWYANADFCLVHVDTPPNDEEWIQESSLVFPLEGQANDPPSDDKLPVESEAHSAQEEKLAEKVIHTFSELTKLADGRKKIHWATRGWTLQELVLSRVTYYFNSAWTPLDRDVGVLGPYYYLAPFIKQYLSLHFVESEYDGAGVSAKDFDKNKAEGLIKVLQTLSLEPPRDIEKRTASAQIGKMVYMAAETKDETLNELYEDRLQLDKLRDRIGLINSLLCDFVTQVDAAITEDRKYVQQVGRIRRLANWADGTEPVNASARSILNMASERDVTVPIDQVYSLMGILGVRFPVFPAEGLPKALCRLLDEVVVTSNDVSVFNWSGRYAGSPIRGRSLYPRNIEAFQNPIDIPSLQAQATINLDIVRLFQNERYHKGKRAQAVIWCLDKLIEKTQELGKKCPILFPLKCLVDSIWHSSFDWVGNYLMELQKVVEMLNKAIKNEKIRKKLQQEKKNKKQGKAAPTQTPTDESAPLLSRSSSMMSSKYAAAKSELTSNVSKRLPKASKSSFGLGWKKGKPCKDETKQETIETAVVTAPMEEPAPPAPLPTQPEAEDQEDKENKEENQPSTPLTDWGELETQLNKTAGKIKDGSQNSPEGANPAPDAELHGQTLVDKNGQPQAQESNGSDAKIVCPNPIIVTSAGIRGVFDIQRVVISMQNPEVLRATVQNAVPGQRIEGSCTISTGFSIILVGFTCEKEMLEQQLDVTEVIKSQLSQNSEEPGDGQPNGDGKDTSPSVEGTNATPGEPGDTAQDESRKATQEEVKDEKEATEAIQEVKEEGSEEVQRQPDSKTEESDENVERVYGGKWNEEQRRVHQMIKFVQEDDLHAVAGEWVLARFSDVEGAHWFLCRIELGSADDFYARRIPTDAFSFHDGVPEAGLIDHWQTYMTQQKRLMCEFLFSFLESRIEFQSARKDMNAWGDLVGERLSEEAQQGSYFRLFKEVVANTSRKEATALFRAAGHGLSGAKYKAFAKYLKQAVRDEAIRSVPTKLRPAIRKMTAGGHLFPMMYHPSRDIHMF